MAFHSTQEESKGHNGEGGEEDDADELFTLLDRQVGGQFVAPGGSGQGSYTQGLLLKSPLLRITGSGGVDLGARRLDYRVRATVVDTLQGQGGPELQALRGQTIPVALSGPLDAIQWRIDVAGLAKEAVREKIEARKDEAKDKLREKLGDRLKGLFGK